MAGAEVEYNFGLIEEPYNNIDYDIKYSGELPTVTFAH